jgi:hypothetical protein
VVDTSAGKATITAAVSQHAVRQTLGDAGGVDHPGPVHRHEIQGAPGRIDVVALGSRHATARKAHVLFARGRFRTTGRNSSATVRGRVVAG